MPQKIDRTKRLGEQIKRELSTAVKEILIHPHASMLSFTGVQVTRDLSFAKVYVTHVLDNEVERKELVELLNKQSGQFRHYLSKQMTTRKVPELTFYYDESVEYGANMETLLTDLVKKIPDNDDQDS